MSDFLLWSLLGLALVSVVLLLVLLVSVRAKSAGDPRLFAELAALAAANERLERELRSEVQASARDTRTELTQGLSIFQQALLAQSGDVARTQNTQIDAFGQQLALLQKSLSDTLSLQLSGLS
ncbi:MAG: recombination protein RmuC, partial [Pseudomonadota bacterium]